MYGLQICKLVIVRVHASAEEQAGISPVDNLVVTKLDKVGLILLVTRGDEPVDL